jgi:hypothetical protein
VTLTESKTLHVSRSKDRAKVSPCHWCGKKTGHRLFWGWSSWYQGVLTTGHAVAHLDCFIEWAHAEYDKVDELTEVTK